MRKRSLRGALAAGLLAGLVSFFTAPAAPNESGGLLAITDENDAWSNFFGPHQDRHYTHGLKLTYLAADDFLPDTTAWLNQIPQWGMEKAVGNVGVVAGQNMFTPENILDPQPIPTDRPYAGWLYAGLVFQRHAEPAANVAVMENFEINFGVVGHHSYADAAQKLIHRWRFPEDIPQGWDNQIENEPGLILKYARLWRLAPTAGTAKYFDVIPRAGIELGNVAILGTVGAAARLGFNLPPDFGVQIIDSPASANGRLPSSAWFSSYVFAGVEGRAVLHDITLDGNSFRNGPSVEKYNFVNDLSWGLALQAGRHFEFSYAQVTRSKEFVGQQHKDVFGSLELKFFFAF